MRKFSDFVIEKFGRGETGKFKASQALGRSQKTIYNWCSSDNFWAHESDSHYKIMEIKAELLK